MVDHSPDHSGYSPSVLAELLAQAHNRIATAASAAGRDPDEVQLLVAVKDRSASEVAELGAAGGLLIGHNRAQELEAMAAELAAIPDSPSFTTHFIGRLQSNKAQKVVPLVDCVQSVDSVRLAERLNRLADARERDLEVFVQVNTSAETTKGGVAPEGAEALATKIAALPRLRLRGLMTIGANSTDEAVVRASYERLAALRDAVVASGAPGTTEATELSMGMSRDLEIAVAAGATMVRLGTAVFGSERS